MTKQQNDVSYNSAIFVPNPTQFSEASAFVQSVIKENKQISENRSHTYLSRKLGWPRTLLAEIAAGRKSLSLRRVIEFCRTCDLDTLATEHLILLALKENAESDLSQFSDARIADRQQTPYPPPPIFDFEGLHPSDHTLVNVYLHFRKKLPNAEELRRELAICPHITPEYFDQLVRSQLRQGRLKLHANGRVEASEELIYFDEITSPQTPQPCENYFAQSLNFVQELRQRPAFFLCGYAGLQPDDVRRLSSPAFAFRESVVDCAWRAQDQPSQIFQYIVSVHPMGRPRPND